MISGNRGRLVAAAVAAAATVVTAAEPAAERTNMEKSNFVICKQPGRYIGWPTVARTAGGELLAVFSGDREAHVCPFGRTQLVRSSDGGKTWSAPATINKTPLDDRDAGLVVTHQGTLIASWFTSLAFEELPEYRRLAANQWREPIAKITGEDRRRWLGHWVRRSEDGGRTWGEAINSIVNSPHGPIELKDGRLLYLGIKATQGSANGPKVPDDQLMAAAESRDDGRSWKVVGHVPVPKGVPASAFCELHAAETADGRLVGMIRREADPGKGFLWQTESADGGRTWSEAHQTKLWGHPPHLLALGDGRLLVSYGHRRKPFGQRACLSRDGGRTWDLDREIVIRDDAPDGDLGYPSSVQLDDGTILTVYYQVDKSGEKTCLMGTRWKLPRKGGPDRS